MRNLMLYIESTMGAAERTAGCLDRYSDYPLPAHARMSSPQQALLERRCNRSSFITFSPPSHPWGAWLRVVPVVLPLGRLI